MACGWRAPCPPLIPHDASPSLPHSTQSASVLENVASLAFKARLKECRRADVFMSCDWRTLMEGRINSVKVVGEGWRSPLDLTAQVLEVGGCGTTRLSWR